MIPNCAKEKNDSERTTQWGFFVGGGVLGNFFFS